MSATIDTKKQILVTGGTGMIGAYLIRYLLQQGYRNIRATKRADSRMDLIAPVQDQIEWMEADICDVPAMERAMKGVKQLYHSAAHISYDTRDASKMMRINGEGTANVVNLALYEGIEKMIHVSSIAAIGRTVQERHIKEKFQWQRSKWNTNYAISKFTAEQEVWRGVAEGLNAAIVNPAVVIGGGFWNHGTGRLFTHVWKENPFYAAGTTGFVDGRDVARFMIKLMESNISEERFILVSENWTYKKLLETIAIGLGKRQPPIKAVPIIRETAWRLEWIMSRIKGTHPMITKESSGNSSRTFYYYNEKSLEHFPDFQYTPVEQSVLESTQAFLYSKKHGLDGMYLDI